MRMGPPPRGRFPAADPKCHPVLRERSPQGAILAEKIRGSRRRAGPAPGVQPGNCRGSTWIAEAGGVVSDWAGIGGLPRSGNIVAGSPRVHAALLEATRAS
jgi:hypothetical protein